MEQDSIIHRSGIIPKLQNVVTTANVGTEINLEQLAQHVNNVTYRPRRFPAARFPITEPKATVLVFRTGKLLCTGARTEEDARAASRKVAKKIKSAGFHFILIYHDYIDFTSFHQVRKLPKV